MTTIAPDAFLTRVGALLEREGTVMTAGQLERMAERYLHCPGKEIWDIREYRGAPTPGAREYRVMRGTRVQDVYTSTERDRAAAVRNTLNELESQDDNQPS